MANKRLTYEYLKSLDEHPEMCGAYEVRKLIAEIRLQAAMIKNQEEGIYKRNLEIEDLKAKLEKYKVKGEQNEGEWDADC